MEGPGCLSQTLHRVPPAEFFLNHFKTIMNYLIIAMFGTMEIVLILAVVLILFGAKKLPELAKGLGIGIREFRKATREVEEDVRYALESDPAPRPQLKHPASGLNIQKAD